MPIRSFSEYLEEQRCANTVALDEQPVSKTLEFANDGFEIVINITLSRQDQHADAVQFLRRVADELTALDKATDCMSRAKA